MSTKRMRICRHASSFLSDPVSLCVLCVLIAALTFFFHLFLHRVSSMSCLSSFHDSDFFLHYGLFESFLLEYARIVTGRIFAQQEGRGGSEFRSASKSSAYQNPTWRRLESREEDSNRRGRGRERESENEVELRLSLARLSPCPLSSPFPLASDRVTFTLCWIESERDCQSAVSLRHPHRVVVWCSETVSVWCDRRSWSDMECVREATRREGAEERERRREAITARL